MGHVSNTHDDLVNLPDFAMRKCEPLDTPDGISLSTRFQDTAFPQKHSDLVTLRDHALNFRLLVAHAREVSSGCGDYFLAASPCSNESGKSANGKFYVVRYQ